MLLPTYDFASIVARLTGPFPQDTPSAEREAAVAAILRPSPEANGDAQILFIRRAEHPQDPWSGHMAFPGGRRDDSDTNLLATAIRETREEVGLDLRAYGTLIARLADTPAIARGKRVGMTITPFVFAIHPKSPPLSPNAEVSQTMWTPVGPLARGECQTSFPYLHEGQLLELPALRAGERVVWGLTYQMLQAFFARLHRP
ncbi:MAG: CoA pyrophosphatase [Myxococcales bacterium]